MGKKIETFAEKLAQLMANMGLSGYALAKRSGLGESTIGNYLKGRREPGFRQLTALAEALGVSISEFEDVAERDTANV